MLWFALGLALLLYVGLLLLLRLNEGRLLYFPGDSRVLAAPDLGTELPLERVEIHTADSITLVAWALKPVRDDARWLLICHGNAGNISDPARVRQYAALRELGVGILAFDYRGYGESGGTPSEQGLYRDAEAAYRYLRDRGVPPERLVLFGHSLGSAVAVELAGRVPAAGLILEGALTSVVDRAQEIYRWAPVRWIAISRFGSLERVARLTLPKLFLHAAADDVVPLSHGRRLYQAAPGPKVFVELRGGHGDAFEVDSARYFGAIAGFLAGHPAAPADGLAPRTPF
jgi:fermentation-respiration switch protein FrsA (DUF1100 family)